ncbi:PaaX family transcriptional regulator [Catenulispora sp. NF23]|uniref:PaaX family transcriptional regulator n=1 Tax=Catenulispora pinistramenti TaxID=2705254 RepID=A0ABS5L4B2_9ACTN|nr:PaaX family transcriptional regulator C-terminal domain-containing protein [Catenulispora pinistramenti]MBS2537474.1 PaaX family transcriptional regulator [Catenulispora pinistramenti]MBS2553067.1 PaaX family transcriptional regulator [Catenulispora pinistramenti]
MSADDDLEPVPSLTRRQQTGARSARSLLLTVLGEYVRPGGVPVWTSTLLHVAAGLGLEEKTARQALNRMALDGWIGTERVGRRVRWALTPHGTVLLTEGAERIYSFGRDRESWDGRWLVLLVSVPETQRDLRHRLRNSLTWAGLGSPAPGVWVSPHTTREAEAKQIVEELGLQAEAISFCGPFAGVGSERSMVEQAWHTGELAEAYEDFLLQFAGLSPQSPDEVLYAQIRLVDEWRRFPSLDPQLPPELLPPQWIGLRAASVFEDLHQRWNTAARARWSELAARE